MDLWRSMGLQLRKPQGRAAGLTGAAMRAINRGPYRLALDALAVQPSDDVLELGFGPGEGVRALSAQAPRGLVWGVDHSPSMLAQASARNLEAIEQDRVRLRLGGFEALPLANGSVDKVLAVNVAYFWGDGGAVLEEISRVLRPGGRLCAYVTDEATMRGWPFARRDSHQLFDRARLGELLSRMPRAAGPAHVDRAQLAPGFVGLLATVERAADA